MQQLSQHQACRTRPNYRYLCGLHRHTIPPKRAFCLTAFYTHRQIGQTPSGFLVFFKLLHRRSKNYSTITMSWQAGFQRHFDPIDGSMTQANLFNELCKRLWKSKCACCLFHTVFRRKMPR
jgi:hypothetical protein